MVDYERALGDLGFRRTKEEQGRRLALGGGGGRWRRRRLGFAGRGVVCLEGQPCPSLYRWEGATKGRGVPPQLGLGWRAGLGRRDSSPKSVLPPLACFPQFPVLAV